MPYNYLDFIRDQYRREQTQRRPLDRFGIRSRDPYQDRLDSINAQARPDAVSGRKPALFARRDFRGNVNFPATRAVGADASPRNPYGSNLGEPLSARDTVGEVILGPGRDGTGPSSAAGYNRPNRLFGTGTTDAEYKALGYNHGAYNPTPARQAASIAAAGNAQLNDGDARAQAIATGKNVLSDSGATYFPSGGFARTAPVARPVTEAIKDFTNPVLNPESAAAYLNASRAPSSATQGSAGPVSRFNAVEGTSIDAANPSVPIVGTQPRPVAAKPNTFGAFGIPNVGALGAGVREGVSNYLERARRSFDPYTKREEDQY